MEPGEQFKFKRILGKGSYGIVAEFFDTKQNEEVAIKKLNPIEDIIDAKRMLREIRILSNLQHENILRLQYIITKKNDAKFYDVYLVTDLWQVDLSRVIRKNREDLTDDHIQYIAYQMFRGLHYLHSGKILHRDLKPSNVLVNTSSDVCICDFGFAREVVSNEAEEDLTEYVVTRFYRAPEIMLQSSKYGPSIDIWSVGCTLYELLEGKPLFNAKHYLELIKDILKKLGTPDEKSLSFIKNPEAIKFIKKQPFYQKQKLSQKMKGDFNPKVLDLIDKCMIFDPSQRITTLQALQHPYFKDIYDQQDIVECFQEINFDFENDQTQTLDSLKILIMKEIESFNKSNDKEFVAEKDFMSHMFDTQSNKQLVIGIKKFNKFCN